MAGMELLYSTLRTHLEAGSVVRRGYVNILTTRGHRKSGGFKLKKRVFFYKYELNLEGIKSAMECIAF
jgi:hypothetical protein